MFSSIARAQMRITRTKWKRRLLVAVPVVGLVVSACRDFPSEATTQRSKTTESSDVGHAFTSVVDSFIPGPVPGRNTMSLGIRDSATAIDSVLWPASFTDRTRVRLTVVGRLNRRYSESMQPSFNNIKGTLYYKLDADGEYVSSMCNGRAPIPVRAPTRDQQV